MVQRAFGNGIHDSVRDAEEENERECVHKRNESKMKRRGCRLPGGAEEASFEDEEENEKCCQGNGGNQAQNEEKNTGRQRWKGRRAEIGASLRYRK